MRQYSFRILLVNFVRALQAVVLERNLLNSLITKIFLVRTLLKLSIAGTYITK